MKEFDWNKFKKKKITVHCKTLEESENFLSEANKQGIVWWDGRPINVDKDWTCWYKNAKRTSYSYSLLFPYGIYYEDVRYWDYDSRCDDKKLVRWLDYMENDNENIN